MEPGGILTVRNSRLVFLPLDFASGRTTGAPVVIADGLNNVGDSGPTAYAPFSASRGGVLAFGYYNEVGGRLEYRDRTGRFLDSPVPAGAFVEFSPSPDGSRFLLLSFDRAFRSNAVHVLLNWPALLPRK